MQNINILVVDDEAEVQRNCAEEFTGSPFVRLFGATSVDSALQIIQSTYINVALVDMQIGSSRNNGMVVIKYLADNRPSCRTLLLTQHPEVYAKQLFDLLNPCSLKIHGAINKQRFAEDWLSPIHDFSKSWNQTGVIVEGAADIASRFSVKKSQQRIDTTEDEIDAIVSRLLGQTLDTRESSEFDMKRIRLELFGRGRSSAAVAVGQPQNAFAQDGVWCVIKFSPLSEARQEYERYCRFVRFIVSQKYRVELLGYAEGDTVGAMCYTVAGSTPEKVEVLEDLLLANSEKSFSVVNSLFGSDSRFWYSFRGPNDETLTSFFHRVYGLEPGGAESGLADRVRDLFERAATQIHGARISGKELIITGDKLASPEGALGSPFLRKHCETTIVHGDMNSGNIVCSESGSAILIDYRYAGFGPRTLDFAALECSVRLACVSGGFDAIARTRQVESNIWRAVWDGPGPAESHINDFWARFSVALGHLCRSNFSDLEQKEYAATCFLWALRVFRVQSLSEVQRFRILVWASHLARIIIA